MHLKTFKALKRNDEIKATTESGKKITLKVKSRSYSKKYQVETVSLYKIENGKNRKTMFCFR